MLSSSVTPRNTGVILMVIAISLFASPLFADVIQWRSGHTKTDIAAAAGVHAALTGSGLRERIAEHIVVQFEQPLTVKEKQVLAGSGLKLLTYLGNNAFFASVTNAKLDTRQLDSVKTRCVAMPVERNWKLHPSLIDGEIYSWAVVEPFGEKYAEDKSENQSTETFVAVYVLFHEDVSLLTEGVDAITAVGGKVRSKLLSINGLVVELPVSAIEVLADNDKVRYMEPPLPQLSEMNDSNRIVTQADEVQQAPYGLDGSGVTVLVYDGGEALASHGDFGGRLTVRDSSGTEDHATHVAGTIGGDGSGSNGRYRGMAPGVTMESYGFETPIAGAGFLYTDPGDLEADYNEAINTYGAVISNNSIGTNTSYNEFPCEWTGDYGVTAALIDAIANGSLGSIRIVWANGNERGVVRCGTGYASTAPPSCAKNHISVGALNSDDDSMTDFSSWGPVDDGRLKPDVSAPGCQTNGDEGVTSTSSDGGYVSKCGTSMATPTVTGLSALLLQDYRNYYPGQPDFSNSMLKVFLAHTAEDIEQTGPDYSSGYGSVRIKSAIDFMRSGSFVEAVTNQNVIDSYVLVVSPGDEQLKVTLAWDDVPGTPNVIPSLVNDLDLRVYSPSSDRYFPWTLDPANPEMPASQNAEDHLNNMEQVVVNNPQAGTWRIEVVGYNIPQGPQAYSLAGSPVLVNCSSGGLISLDNDQYTCDSTISLRVVDCDLNTDDTLIETVTVGVISDVSGTSIPVLLTETAAGSAAFEGELQLSPVAGSGTLLVAHGATVTATYLDADDGVGGTNVPMSVTASVDCVAPVIQNITTSQIVPRGATIEFDTSEPATGTLRYGTDCGLLDHAFTAIGFNQHHTIQLENLLDELTYYYIVEAADEAGNQSSDDNSGSCYSFTTPDVPDYMTELFGVDGDNDLSYRSITYTPDGSPDYYSRCIEEISTLPTNPAGGIEVDLDDDSYKSIDLTGGTTVSLYGVAYNRFYIVSNGYITFVHGQTDSSETLEDHFNMPRISALFDDLNPHWGGPVVWQQFSDRVVVTWQNIPEYQTSNSNTFQVEMFYDGRIRINCLEIAAIDGLAGLSDGNGLPTDFYPTDLSASGDCTQQPPSTQGMELVVDIDTSEGIELVGFDLNGDALDFIITDLPDNGTLYDPGVGEITAVPYTLSGAGRQVVYTPDNGFAGDDDFEYLANDGTIDSNVSEVSIMVLALAPTILTDQLPDGVAGAEYGPVQLEVAGGQPQVQWSMVTDHVYKETDLGSSLFAETGVAQGWHDDDKYWTYTLPFSFPYYGVDQETVRVWSNGFLNFGPHTGNNAYNTVALLKENIRICPLWDDLRTTGSGEDIFIDESVSGQVTIRWKASTFNGNYPVNFSVALRNDGLIIVNYGPGNAVVTPTIGISAGDEAEYTISAYDGSSSLTNANSMEYRMIRHLPAGMTFSSTGVLQGTPMESGYFEPIFVATDSLDRTDQKTIPLSIQEFVPGDHDYDDDGDVDLEDFAFFQACFTGADKGPAAAGCEVFFVDADYDIDDDDFFSFQQAFTGP